MSKIEQGGMSKAEQLENLFGGYRKEFEGEPLVFGSGNADSPIVLVGEAPGKDEVRLLQPFVGPAGKNLSEFLGLLGLSRESIYITNVIKYRLSRVNAKTGRVVNRPAAKEDVEKNREYLRKELEIISPGYIVTLGNVPLKAVTGDKKITVGSVHGQALKGAAGSKECILFPLYHPASILYNRSLKDEYINDIHKLAELLK